MSLEMRAFELWWAELQVTEGIKANDKQDPGGPTLYGVSSASFPEVYNLIASAPVSERLALVRNFYYNYYWCKYNRITNPRIRIEYCDTAVNCGDGNAALFAQRSCNLLASGDVRRKRSHIDEDKDFGPKTVGEINYWSKVNDGYGAGCALFKLMNLEQGMHYRHLATKSKNLERRKYFAVCLRGWTKRLQDWHLEGLYV